MNFTKERKIIEQIDNDKKEYIEELIKSKVINKDTFSKINEITNNIEKKMIEIEKADNLDLGKISKLLNQLILDKVFLTKQISSINYFKGKYDIVKANTKLGTISNSFNDGELGLRGNNTDLVLIKLDNLTSYQNLIQDLLIRVKTTKELIDTTIMVLQSQLKNVSFEYINAGKISQ